MTIILEKEQLIKALQKELERQGIFCELGPERVRFVETEGNGYEITRDVHYVEIFIPDKE